MSTKNLWRTVVGHRQLLDDFSEDLTSQVPTVDLSGPQVYRFLFSDKNGRSKSSYIGQSCDFSRRYREYRNMNKPTERHVRASIHSAESSKYTAELQFLDFEELDLFGVLVVKQLLTNSHVRRMLESWAILKDERAKIHILNSQRGTKVIGPNGRIAPQPNRTKLYSEIDRLDGKTK